jgi:hypothetical protein
MHVFELPARVAEANITFRRRRMLSSDCPVTCQSHSPLSGVFTVLQSA